MIYDRPSSDNRPSYRPPYQPPYGQERPAYQAFETLAEGKLVLEYKTFLFSLRENQRGRVLRISEVANGRFNTIMIPASGLEDIRQILDEMVRSGGEIPGMPDSEPVNHGNPATNHVQAATVAPTAPAAPVKAKATTKANKIMAKTMVAEIFKAENPAEPLSDQEVVKLLAEKGVNTTRRTVAVYRDELGILASYERKVS